MRPFKLAAPESQAAFIPVQSAAAVEQESERQSPRIAVDPMMSEPAAGSSGKSFSDLDELPPPQGTCFHAASSRARRAVAPGGADFSRGKRKKRSQKFSRRGSGAEKAIKEISTVPPRLMIYSILGAVGLIVLVAIAIWFHVRSEDDGSTAAPRPAKAAASTPAQPVVETPKDTGRRGHGADRPGGGSPPGHGRLSGDGPETPGLADRRQREHGRRHERGPGSQPAAWGYRGRGAHGRVPRQ